VTLDERQLNVLRRVGHEWGRACGNPEVWRRALPVDPSLSSYPDPTDVRPTRFGRFVPVQSTPGPGGGAVGHAVEATGAGEVSSSPRGRLGHDLRRTCSARPEEQRHRPRADAKARGAAVLSADALSSVAYGPEAMLAILVLAGSGGLGYSLPIAATIALLMIAVGVSYRQTIRAYPHGGGSYIVAATTSGACPA